MIVSAACCVQGGYLFIRCLVLLDNQLPLRIRPLCQNVDEGFLIGS